MSPQNPLPVYVIHWEAPELCARTVASVARSAGVDVQVTVIENSADRGEALRSRISDSARLLVSTTNVGFAGGANVAIDDWRQNPSLPRFCVIMSHDVTTEPDTLWHLVQTLESNPQFGVVGPALAQGSHRTAGGTWDGWRARLQPINGVEVSPRTSDWLMGACLVLRGSAVDEVGRFEERFGSYVEDVDFCLRVRDAGWEVAAVVDARATEAGSTSKEVTRFIDRNTIWLGAKRGGLLGAAKPLTLIIWLTVRSLASAARHVRSDGRRRSSMRMARLHLLGLFDVVCKPGQLFKFAREARTQGTKRQERLQ